MTVSFVFALIAGSYLQEPAQTPRDLYTQGTKQFSEGKFQEAKGSFEGAVSADRMFAAGYRGLGLADLALKDYQGAYRAWIKAVELDEKDEKSRYCLGRLFYDANMPNEAATWLRQAVELDANDYEALTYLGLAAEALGFDDTAAQLYKKAIAVSERQGKPYSWAFLSFANYLKKHSDEPQAMKVLEEGARKCPEAHELSALGEMLAAQGDRGRAEQNLRQAISLDPTISQAHYRLALLLKSSGRNQEAQDEILKFQQTKAEEDKAPKVMALRKSDATAR